MAYSDADPDNNYKVYSGKLTKEKLIKALKDVCRYDNDN